MSINIKTLLNVLNDVSGPEHDGDRRSIQLPSRVDEINMCRPINNGSANIKEMVFTEYTLIAVKYCEGTHCWLEWELEL